MCCIGLHPTAFDILRNCIRSRICQLELDTSFSLPNSFCSSAPWYERKKGALSLDIDSLGESKLAHVRSLAYAQKSRLWTQLLLAFSKEMKSGTSNYSLRLTSTRIHSRCCTCSALSLTASTIHSLSLCRMLHRTISSNLRGSIINQFWLQFQAISIGAPRKITFRRSEDPKIRVLGSTRLQATTGAAVRDFWRSLTRRSRSSSAWEDWLPTKTSCASLLSFLFVLFPRIREEVG